MHREIYEIGRKLPKREKLGIHATVEKISLELLMLVITAAFQPRQLKVLTLETLRVRIEVLKHLTRSEHELDVLTERLYLRLAARLVEISKETNWWLASLTQKGA